MSAAEISKKSMSARNQKQHLMQFAPKVLLQVNENIIHSNSLCTELLFEDGDRRWMKIETFDRDGSITRKAKLLINQRVSITSWDPLEEPLKWTNLGYFSNVYKAS